MVRKRTLVSLISLVFLVATLGGCVSQPEFRSPVGWGDALRLDPGELFENNEIGTTLVVYEDRTGVAIDFPVGSKVSSGDEPACLERVGEELYSGPVTWAAVDAREIEVRFGESVVPVLSGPSKFGGQNWSEVVITECRIPPRQWLLYSTCGDTGTGSASFVRCEEKAD